MAGISLPELLVIFVVILIVVGPQKLPELAQQLGRWMREFRKTSDAVRREFYNSVYTPVQESKLQIESSLKKLVTEKESPKTTPATTPDEPAAQCTEPGSNPGAEAAANPTNDPASAPTTATNDPKKPC